MNLTSEVPYTPFFENVLRAARDTATIIKHPITGWFEENEDVLIPPIEEKHALLSAWRNASGEIKTNLLESLRNATKKVKDCVAIAKENWSRKKAEKISQMNMFPGEAWKAAREVTARDSCHHQKPTIMKMKMENGNLASNDKQNVDVFVKHLTKVDNNKRERLCIRREIHSPKGNHHIARRLYISQRI